LLIEQGSHASKAGTCLLLRSPRRSGGVQREGELRASAPVVPYILLCLLVCLSRMTALETGCTQVDSDRREVPAALTDVLAHRIP
jgi:hypothetical protein